MKILDAEFFLETSVLQDKLFFNFLHPKKLSIGCRCECIYPQPYLKPNIFGCICVVVTQWMTDISDDNWKTDRSLSTIFLDIFSENTIIFIYYKIHFVYIPSWRASKIGHQRFLFIFFQGCLLKFLKKAISLFHYN